uniref:tRNA (guanine-N(1)-)-methyltransferase n=1 Tax=candidate division CPR3 bacterium TaxID=2268181 RepID=A0A7C4M0D5_UNCC3
MKIDIITLFPEMFKGPFTESIVKRAQGKGLVEIKTHQLRDWAINDYGQVDDRPYGGGSGMLMRIDVAFVALNSFSQKNPKSQITNHKQIQNPKSKKDKPYIILPTPSGKKFDQAMARKLAKKKHLIFLCPHYEGYDHRIESLVDEKISIGDYVLTGGELPAMVITDAVVRLVPGVISEGSLKEESFSENPKSQISMPNQILNPKSKKNEKIGHWSLGFSSLKYEYPQYTRPEIFEATICGKKVKKRVPKVLLSGNHAEIKKWREKNKK